MPQARWLARWLGHLVCLGREGVAGPFGVVRPDNARTRILITFVAKKSRPMFRVADLGVEINF